MGIDSAAIEKLVYSVVKEMVRENHLNKKPHGEFLNANDAVEAAWIAQQRLGVMPIEKREDLIAAIREAAVANAQLLAEMAVKESGMGRAADKIIKNKIAALKTPGTIDLKTDAFSGDKGLTIVEMAPFGVICAITPATNPVATIINNGISMLAAGNSVVFCPHPSLKETSRKTLEILNNAIIMAGGPENLLSYVAEPGIKIVEELMQHEKIRLIVATGGPGVVKAVLKSGKKAIGAGAGNPPVIVDATADLDKAAKSIVDGATFDNNLPCIAEKAVFALGAIADILKSKMLKNDAVEVKGIELKQLEELVLTRDETGDGTVRYAPNKQYIGKDAAFILDKIGIKVHQSIRGIIAEVDVTHPFVTEELMMPILPLVQVKDIDTAISMAVKVEHGYRHTAVIHSKNVDNMTRFAKAIQTTLFVKNAPSYAGIGIGGEGFTTFTIAGPTGEGLTSARSFTRQRRCVLVDAFSIV